MRLQQLHLQLNHQSILKNIDWQIDADEQWAVLGTNACGKSSLARVLTGELAFNGGELNTEGKSVEWVSLESQQVLYERELYRDDTDFMDQFDTGTPVRQLLAEIAPWSELTDQLCDQLMLTPLLERGYRLLSSGEGRRVMLARALLAEPDWLILDEPFEGLDRQSRDTLKQAFCDLMDAGHQLLFLVNQRDDIPARCSHLVLMDRGEFIYTGTMPDNLAEQWQHLVELRRHEVTLPQRQSEFQLPDWPDGKPLVHLLDGFVQYDETFQFRDVNWQLRPGEHTQIIGQNGCGKSTLLGLITGDHPQCYRNRLSVVGFQRGQGESIWQIKKHLGYVSGALHRDYRASGNALTVVASGLTDSIGVYQALGETEQNLARDWLALVGLSEKANTAFKSLSMGEQRLVLIARALIKQPPLLILDEPTQGLDDFNRFYVLSIVEKILANGPTTLLFVSHRQDESLGCIHNTLEFQATNEANVLFRPKFVTP
ncbi:MAG: ATP-binding cassette domain-containing protein [Reinekea sp.]|jgi:molybdate transport system ATP-binding protein